MFLRRFRKHDAGALVADVSAWLADYFMDGPKGGGKSEIAAPSYASYPVYIFDLLAEAGFGFTYAEVMGMPLKRLWQFWRVASRRVNGTALTNPSDALVVAQLEKGAA